MFDITQRILVLAGLATFVGTALLSFLFGAVGCLAGGILAGAVGFVLVWPEWEER